MTIRELLACAQQCAASAIHERPALCMSTVTDASTSACYNSALCLLLDKTVSLNNTKPTLVLHKLFGLLIALMLQGKDSTKLLKMLLYMIQGHFLKSSFWPSITENKVKPSWAPWGCVHTVFTNLARHIFIKDWYAITITQRLMICIQLPVKILRTHP